MKSQTESVAESYDRWAENYDDYEVNNESLARVRKEIYKHVFAFLQPEDHILEINAGTGTDAQYFAQNGFRVHATELSSKMVRKIDEKIKQFDLSNLMTSQQLSFTDLDTLDHNTYQFCFSNIGGLNCIPDIYEVAKNVPLVLSPGGIITMVIMSRICPWEWMEIFRGNYSTAIRRFHKDGATANKNVVPYQIYYFTPGQVRTAFGSKFRLVKLQSLSLFGPPIDRKGFYARNPGLSRALIRIDDVLTHRYPFNHWGDFFILSLRYEP